MDILNQLSAKKFREVDDLLAFISIYDDQRRASSYRSLLRAHKNLIRGSVCVEGGCGLGLFSVELAKLGASKVYAVEQNESLVKLASRRFNQLPADLRKRIELVHSPLQRFKPRQPVDVLVHEFYGQLLFDEDLWVLDHLRFKPKHVLPNGGELWAGAVSSTSYRDKIVTPEVVSGLDGILVSGLFQEKLKELRFPVLRWEFGKGLLRVPHSFRGWPGDLACFGVKVTHNRRAVCEAGRCPNWSYVWTLKKGTRASFRFRRSGGTMDCDFGWVF